jgi:transposase-like protein
MVARSRRPRPATPQKTEKLAEAKWLIAAGATQAAAAAAIGVSKQLLFAWLRQEEQAVKKVN